MQQLLQEVKHFLATDQPGMACLYMRKALELLKKEKEQGALDRIRALFLRAVEVIAGAWNAVVEAVAPAIAAVASFIEAFQSDYALAAEK